MITRESVTAVLDGAYADEPDEVRWLDGIRAAAERAFEGCIAAVAHTTSVCPDGRARILNLAGMSEISTLGQAVHDAASPEVVRSIYLAGPVQSSVAIAKRSGDPGLSAMIAQMLGRVGATDVVGAIGSDPSGAVCALAFLTPDKGLSRGARATLTRLAGHLATAYRLRRGDGRIDAVLAPDGRVLDGDGALVDEAGASLRHAALSVDRARGRARTEPDAALAQWKAMTEGRWTLVERFESDGRRILVARENAPETRKLRALSENERKVLALSALGHASKLVAYELGFAESTVSGLLKSALGKLGLRSKTELIELHGALLGAGPGRLTEE